MLSNGRFPWLARLSEAFRIFRTPKATGMRDCRWLGGGISRREPGRGRANQYGYECPCDFYGAICVLVAEIA